MLIDKIKNYYEQKMKVIKSPDLDEVDKAVKRVIGEYLT